MFKITKLHSNGLLSKEHHNFYFYSSTGSAIQYFYSEIGVNSLKEISKAKALDILRSEVNYLVKKGNIKEIISLVHLYQNEFIELKNERIEVKLEDILNLIKAPRIEQSQ